MMDEEYIRAAELVSRYVRDDITSGELTELTTLLEKYPALRSWINKKSLPLKKINKLTSDYSSIDLDTEWQLVLAKRNQRSRSKVSYKKWFGVAASVIAICLVGGSLFLGNKSDKLDEDQQEVAAIVPGKDAATLTLSDGSTVMLGDNETQAIVDGDIMVDVSGSMLDYRSTKDAEVHIHRLQVPVGGTYHVQLADGTKVWLNADSELEFPSAFVMGERKVKVRGEAYFEVAKDPSRPFRVEVADTEIEALGTAFNINTHLYKGKIKTILTEGKVKVSSSGQTKVIEHGYETISGQGNIQVGKADIEEALAWKDGYFYFDSKSFKEVLEEVARWYKIDVDIRVALSDKRYRGGIKKSESIQTVCAVLSDLTTYKVSVENRKLIIK